MRVGPMIFMHVSISALRPFEIDICYYNSSRQYIVVYHL